MDNIRTESFLGSDKVIVGNRYTDLVLETLGKVYVKTGNNSRVLSDVLALLDKPTESEIESQTIIVNSLLEMEQMEYPGDGFFIYNTLTTTLYISYDLRYIALIEATEDASNRYVRRKGDTMTGLLEINTVGPPLIVASSKLVNNLNSEFIDGYSADDLAKKRIDEYITGNWTFRGKGVSESNWTFKRNVRMYGDLVTSRSITSPEFASGFGGYGWRLDADTNTLTIDYLVVRKTMKVYEMVINKISATNGSIWVSNSSKCESAVQPTILTDKELESITSWTGSPENKDAALKIIKSDTYYLPIPSNGANTESTISLTSELSGPSEINSNSKTFVNYKFIVHVKDPVGLVNNPLFKGMQTLYDETLLTSSSGDVNHTTLLGCISLHYISKEIVVTKWTGQLDEDTKPIEWEYKDTFNKKFPLFMIPKGTEPTSGRLYTDLYELATSQEEARRYIFQIYPYYKYFALETSVINSAIQESNSEFDNGYVPTATVPNLWVVNTDDNEYPMFKAGDIIRCQKYTNGNIKYYDAIVLAQTGARQFIIQKATSVFDKYTEICYNEDGSVRDYKEKYNTTLYTKTEKSYNPITGKLESNSSSKTTEARVDDIAAGDDMIQMGNICDVLRQNAIYLTSCDDDGPFIDVISGLNRPDYSVLYDIPIYRRHEYIHRQDGVTFKYNGTKYNYYLQENQPPSDVDYIPSIRIGDREYYGTLYPTKDSELLVEEGKYRHAYTKTTRVRVGNLDGIYNEIFGTKLPYGYGLYGENVFLTGEFYLNNGLSVVDFSQEGIFLKFKEAGLYITKDKDSEKAMITLDADKVLIGNGDNNIGTLFTVEDGRAYIRTDFIKADEIQVKEIYNNSYNDTADDYSPIPYSLKPPIPISTSKEPLGVLNPPYDIAKDQDWVTSMIGGSGVFKDPEYPNAIGFFSVLLGELAHIMSPIITLENIKLKEATLTLSLGEYSADTIDVLHSWIYLVNAGVKYDLSPTVDANQVKFNLNTFNFNPAEITKIIVGLSLVATDENIEYIQPFTDISINIKYHQGILNWALRKDGSGSLGRGGLFWDKEGNTLLIGTFLTGKEQKKMRMYYDTSTNNPIFDFVLGDKTAIKMTYSSYSIPSQFSRESLEIPSGVISLELSSKYTSIYAGSMSIAELGKSSTLYPGNLIIRTLNNDVVDIQSDRILFTSNLIYSSTWDAAVQYVTFIARGEITIGPRFFSMAGKPDYNSGEFSNILIMGNPFNLTMDGKGRKFAIYRTITNSYGFTKQSRDIDASAFGDQFLVTTSIKFMNDWH